MIREEDLREAIAECEGIRNPSASTCIKLASYYALLNHKFGTHTESEKQENHSYSFTSAPASLPFSDSELSRIVEEKGIDRCFPVIDESISALEVVLPKLYRATMRKLEEI